MEREYKMSAARAQELQEELNYLKTTRSDEVAEQIKVARGFGDLSENSEYDEAKNEQGKLYSRIAELEEILQHVVIVDESNAPTNVVTIGCKVTVADKNGNTMPAYRIVGSQESDPMNGIISEESPFGKALVGAKEGDTVTVEAPSGAIVYTVPGGRLLYAVCSVFAEEGSHQIKAFLEAHGDAQAVALPKCSCSQLRLMPCDNPDMPDLIDGFFKIEVMTRKIKTEIPQFIRYFSFTVTYRKFMHIVRQERNIYRFLLR